MSTVFRQATLEDDESFLALALAAFEPIRRLGINFSAAHADIEMVRRHIASHGVYVMEKDGTMVSSFTIRYPWGPEPGPYGLPHLGWFATHPDYKKQGLGRQMMAWLEQNVLIAQLKAPAVSLGTAQSHPWLVEMYKNYGFREIGQANLGKGHLTIYMEKIFDDQRYDQWKKRNSR
ncbi:ribosomal protein S18 acetylase RimI-like enzyme|uniref:Ribosomal protein S18 acetylase RimI-like enzyme n=1 Tax=Brenneria salicis ATCC 15712 = DSM 30166 TaxID=714314 RepID=A0A366I730_9GAMM|nr:GNAT family N-acetyltransferase [Brenneria salicis]NMN90156.1 ribosomal protein S18 acetylase RimI-like enzyme [Brenneria salicis ATCC 15712 = DSM 30166]RBP63223.1 ribosomal protein S18 acetylase RimI-like enzyme [Brenneria salicis ATCC 15712 = DSM 30166]RLM30881.1 GNAT family N-acetyltransferase [Brenneria salicis ATCC 15712 = DSM 30166]